MVYNGFYGTVRSETHDAAQAAALVKSGDWVDYGWAVNTPVAVDAELAKRLPELEGSTSAAAF